MLDLLLSIVFSTSLFLVFSLQKKLDIRPLPVIVINYFTAGITGLLVNKGFAVIGELPASPWFLMAMLMGACFITSFNLMGKTTQQLGVNAAAVSSKMSMVIPVVFALIVIGETVTLLKVAAILIAVAAVYLTSVRKQDSTVAPTGKLYLPLLLFLGCGMVDLLIGYSTHLYHDSVHFVLMPSVEFFMAGVLGLSFVFIFSRKTLSEFTFRAAGLGVLLGVCNYFSLHFIYRALRFGGLDTSVLFPLNNVGVVALSAVLAGLLFRERMSAMNIVGLIASILALLLLIV
ncbi:MAG: EamA/RhaT family transporter [Bacteroidota bacterium]